jgi:hypothetical protein
MVSGTLSCLFSAICKLHFAGYEWKESLGESQPERTNLQAIKKLAIASFFILNQ